MVDPKKIDLTMTTVAILTAPPKESGIDQKELEQVLTPPLSIGQSLQGTDIESIRQTMQELSETMQKIGAAVYQQQPPPDAEPPPSEEAGGGEGGDEGTVEGEFREV